MTPMSDERLSDYKNLANYLRPQQLHEVSAKCIDELLAEVNRLRDVPPEVAAAMERYSNRDRLLRLESYYEHEADLDAIAQHFTSLFKKVS